MAATSALGCGPGDLAPTTGIVRINGQPACAGRVVFLPEGGGPPSLGEIGADGRFTLTTAGGATGASIAKHHVVLKDVRRSSDAKGTSYRASEATEFEVRGNASNELEIDVVVGRGWLAVVDD